MTATLTSTPFIVCAAVLGVAIIAAWATDVSRYIPEARRILTGQANTGQHAVHGKRSHAKVSQRDRTDPFAGLDEPADPDEEADGYIAALQPEPVPVLAAPVPEPLEALPPLDRRDRAVMSEAAAAGMALPSWPAPRPEALASLRDALQAWNPAPAVPQEPAPAPAPVCREPEPGPEAAPEPEAAEPEPELELDWLTTSGLDAFTPVLLLGDVAAAVDRIFARAEEAVSAALAEQFGSEEKAVFAGTSLPGLPDWDVTRPVLALPGGIVPADSEESAA